MVHHLPAFSRHFLQSLQSKYDQLQRDKMSKISDSAVNQNARSRSDCFNSRTTTVGPVYEYYLPDPNNPELVAEAVATVKNTISVEDWNKLQPKDRIKAVISAISSALKSMYYIKHQ